MKTIAQGEKFRVLEHRVFGINMNPFRYYILEDSREATRSQGVDYNVKLSYFYWYTEPQMKLHCHDIFDDVFKEGVWYK